nr:site-specific integrase [uncultured Dysosmobacter sp.]
MAEYPYKQYLKDERGKYIKVYATTAEELAEKVQARQAEIDHLIALQHNPTVSMYAVTWMRLQPSDLSESRLSDFDLSLRLHILPHIGNMHMLDVTADHIADLMKAEAHMSRSMQQKIVFVLKGMFALAVSEGLVANNPCATLKAGGKTSSKKDSLTAEQRQKLIEAVRGTRAYPFVMVGLYAGLRTEEALALQWDAVTLDGDTPCLNIRRKLLWEKGKREPVIYDDLKTDAAWRIVTIPDALVECLQAEKATGASDFVIHDTKGQACTEAAFRAIWSLVERRQLEEYRPKKRRSRAKKRGADGKKVDRRGYHKGCPHTLDFAVTPHTLRRSYATELILGGADLATAQYLLGHKKGETTLNWYVKIMQGRPADTIKKVRAAFDT